MDHQQFLLKLSPEERKSLQQKKNAPGLLRMTLHVGLIILFASLIHFSVPGWPLLILPYGIVLVFLFNLQHECTHKTPFKNALLNEVVGFTCGVVIVQPFIGFRYFHLAHHRYTNDPLRDPELIGHTKPETWREYLLFISTLCYWKSKITLLYQQSFFTLEDSYVPVKAHEQIKLEARVLSFLYIAAFLVMIFYSTALFWIWLLPLIVGFPFLKLYHLAEHGLCPRVENKFANTRTVITNRLAKFITWNMPYHTEHHLLPSVPFHQLPTLHNIVKNHLRITSKGYVAFSDEYLRHVKN